MIDLKPCPCGATPGSLLYNEVQKAVVCGVCITWGVSINIAIDWDDDTKKDHARNTWNAAPRAES